MRRNVVNIEKTRVSAGSHEPTELLFPIEKGSHPEIAAIQPQQIECVVPQLAPPIEEIIEDATPLVFLHYIAAELRNGKVHTAEYTSPHGIRLARKLVLGLDEGRVGYGSIREWIQNSWFKKDAQVYKRLSATLAEFPGIVPILWKALGAATASLSSIRLPSNQARMHQFHQFQKTRKGS